MLGSISIRSVATEHFLLAIKLGMRSRAMRAIWILGLALVAIAFLSGAFSLRQPSVVVLDVGISGIRILSALLMILWVQESFTRDIERKTILMILAYPVSRDVYVASRFCGIGALVFFAVAIWGMALWLLDGFSNWGYALSSRPVFGIGYCWILVGVALDAVVVGAFALMICSVAVTPSLPLFCGIAFAISARSIGAAIDYLEFSPQADPALREHLLPIIEAVRWLLPDLGRLDWRIISLYGTWPDTEVMAKGIILNLSYGCAMLGAAMRFYSRRELS